MITKQDILEEFNEEIPATQKMLERVTGIGPVSQPWEGRVLPLNHTREYLKR